MQYVPTHSICHLFCYVLLFCSLRLSRARYHRAVRLLKRAETRMRTEKMPEALISNRSRDLWSEVNRMKGQGRESALKCIISKTLLCFLWITLVALRRCYNSASMCGLGEGIEMCMVC